MNWKEKLKRLEEAWAWRPHEPKRKNLNRFGAEYISKTNKNWNKGKPRHLHKPTSISKIRKAIKRKERENET